MGSSPRRRVASLHTLSQKPDPGVRRTSDRLAKSEDSMDGEIRVQGRPPCKSLAGSGYRGLTAMSLSPDWRQLPGDVRPQEVDKQGDCMRQQLTP